MKDFARLSIFALFLSLTSNTFAVFGGPFDNGFHYNLQGGTYQVTYLIPNGNGFARFSQNTGTSGALPTGSSVVFYRGIVYEGTAYGIVDPSSKNATGTSTGYNRTASGVPNTSTVIFDGTELTTADNIAGTGVNQSEITFVDGDPDTDDRTFTVDDGTNKLYCNATWTAKIHENKYRLRFRGSGVMHFLGDLDGLTNIFNPTEGFATEGNGPTSSRTVNNYDENGNLIGTETTSTNSNGQISNESTSYIYQLDDDGEPIAGTGEIVVQTRNTTGTVDEYFEGNDEPTIINTSSGGEDTRFEDVGHRVHFQVFGSRVSWF